MSHNEKIDAAFQRFCKRNGQSFSSPSDLERVAYAFASGWRAYHRAHKGRGAEKKAWREKLAARAASPVSEIDHE